MTEDFNLPKIVVHKIMTNDLTIKKVCANSVRNDQKEIKVFNFLLSRTLVVIKRTRTRSIRISTRIHVEEAKQDAVIHVSQCPLRPEES